MIPYKDFFFNFDVYIREFLRSQESQNPLLWTKRILCSDLALWIENMTPKRLDFHKSLEEITDFSFVNGTFRFSSSSAAYIGLVIDCLPPCPFRPLSVLQTSVSPGLLIPSAFSPQTPHPALNYSPLTPLPPLPNTYNPIYPDPLLVREGHSPVIVPGAGLLIWVWRHLRLYYCDGNFRVT